MTHQVIVSVTQSVATMTQPYSRREELAGWWPTIRRDEVTDASVVS